MDAGCMNRFQYIAGFLQYKPCPIPTSLENGFPDKFIGKPEDATFGVEHVIDALKQAGVNAVNGGVVTFRNNLNKIFGTVIDNKKEWAVGCCMLQGIPTMFLDIEVSGYPQVNPRNHREKLFLNFC